MGVDEKLQYLLYLTLVPIGKETKVRRASEMCDVQQMRNRRTADAPSFARLLQQMGMGEKAMRRGFHFARCKLYVSIIMQFVDRCLADDKAGISRAGAWYSKGLRPRYLVVVMSRPVNDDARRPLRRMSRLYKDMVLQVKYVR